MSAPRLVNGSGRGPRSASASARSSARWCGTRRAEEVPHSVPVGQRDERRIPGLGLSRPEGGGDQLLSVLCIERCRLRLPERRQLRGVHPGDRAGDEQPVRAQHTVASRSPSSGRSRWSKTLTATTASAAASATGSAMTSPRATGQCRTAAAVIAVAASMPNTRNALPNRGPGQCPVTAADVQASGRGWLRCRRRPPGGRRRRTTGALAARAAPLVPVRWCSWFCCCAKGLLVRAAIGVTFAVKPILAPLPLPPPLPLGRGQWKVFVTAVGGSSPECCCGAATRTFGFRWRRS